MAQSSTSTVAEVKLNRKQIEFINKLQICKFASINAKDGTPHVTPTWFIYDESEKIIITTGENTVKVRNIQKNLNVAVLMDDGYSYVTVNGKARINNERKETRRQS